MAPAGRLSLFNGTSKHEASPGGRLSKITQIYEGTNQIQRIVIAKHLMR